MPPGPPISHADLAKVRDRQFWLTLAPELRINDAAAKDGSATPVLPAEQHEPLRQLLCHEGYAQFDRLIDANVASQLAAIVARLHGRRIPPVFAFVYDEFWWLAHQLKNVLEPVLGPSY